MMLKFNAELEGSECEIFPQTKCLSRQQNKWIKPTKIEFYLIAFYKRAARN